MVSFQDDGIGEEGLGPVGIQERESREGEGHGIQFPWAAAS